MRGRRLDLIQAAAVLTCITALSCSSDNGGAAPVTPSLDLATFQDPPAEYRPWARWWWPGNDVTPETLRAEIDLLAAAGYGGLEIQAFDAALDSEADAAELERRLGFDTPAYYANLAAALEAARDAGLTVDLTLGSGWPLGGARIPAADSLMNLHWAEWSATAPNELVIEELVPAPTAWYRIAEIAEQSFGERMARFLPAQATLLAVVAAPRVGGRRDSSVIDLTDTLELDPDRLVDLTDQVATDGTLRFTPPDGRWQVVAFFAGPDGQYPQLVAEPDAASGFALDHFDAGLVTAQLEHLVGARTGLEPFYGAPLRALFTDSLEFKTERCFADGFLEEFQARRGYDLTPWLPAVLLPGADNYIFEAGRLERAPEFELGAEDERIRHDYALTLAELFRERFLETGEAWAAERGLGTKVQAYGMDLDTLRAAGAVAYPEAEQLYAGGSDLFLKAVSSGAHLYGRNQVSAEAFVWPGRDHMHTPMKLKAGADKAFLGGINHLIYHGVPYPAEGEFGMGGWTPFSSRYGGTNTFAGNLGPRSAWWEDLPALNRYVARCQYLLRQGEPVADVAVYYPWLGFPTSLALEPDYYEPLLGGYLDGAEPEMRSTPFDAILAMIGEQVPDRRSAWLMRIQSQLRLMEQLGITWEWVNDHSLAEIAAADEAVQVRDREYQAVLLFDPPWMTPEAAEALAAAAEGGAAVLAIEGLPGTQPGFHEHVAGDARVQAAMERLAAAPRYTIVEDPGAPASPMVLDLGVAPALQCEWPDPWNEAGGCPRMIQRRLDSGGRLAFLHNSGVAALASELILRAPCDDAHWLDPWTGAAHPAEVTPAGLLHLGLEVFESIVLVCGDGPRPAGSQGGTLGARRIIEPTATLGVGPWHLAVAEVDGAGGTYEADLTGFFDWRWPEVPELHHALGPGTYTATVVVDDPSAAARWELDLGVVAGVAEVRVNGQDAGRLRVPPFRVDVTSLLVAGENAIEVVLHAAWRNHLVGRMIAGDERYLQFSGKEDTLIRTGLLGPVRVLRGEAE